MSETALPAPAPAQPERSGWANARDAGAPAASCPVRFRLLRPKDLPYLPRASFAIEGLLPMQGVVYVFGASQAGKSALTLSLVAALAHGEPWFCRLTRRLRVCYVVLEGATGMVLRAEALQKHSGKELPDTARFVFDDFSLKTDVEEFCDRIRRPAAPTFSSSTPCSAPWAERTRARRRACGTQWRGLRPCRRPLVAWSS